MDRDRDYPRSAVAVGFRDRVGCEDALGRLSGREEHDGSHCGLGHAVEPNLLFKTQSDNNIKAWAACRTGGHACVSALTGQRERRSGG